MQDGSTGIMITGIGSWTAFGAGWKHTWEALARGESAIAVGGADLPGGETLSVALIRDLAPFRETFPHIRPPLPLKHVRLALVAAREALTDAGVDTIPSTVEIGAMLDRGWDADVVAVQLLARTVGQAAPTVSPLLFSQSVANAPLGGLGIHLGLRGPHLMTIGGGALYLAMCALRDGEATAIVAGGLDEVEVNRLVAFHRRGFIDAAADPTRYGGENAPRTLGEGAVALVLEREDAARARGARAYARIVAFAQRLSHDRLRGASDTRTEEVAALAQSMIARAGRGDARIDLVAGSGSAHRLGGYIGESFGMGSAATLALCAHAVHTRKVPATVLHRGTGLVPIDHGLALIQEIGFEGQLFACLVERDAA